MVGRGSGAIHRLVAAGGLGCLLFGSAHAQGATGKLEGRVQDEAGAPIADAQVHLVGAAFAAVSDVRGHYFINNIPPGTWAVRAAFIGHQPVEVQGFRVLAGQTTTQDFTLAVAPLQLQDIEVRVAWNPLVPRDEVTTKQRIDGRFAEALPVGPASGGAGAPAGGRRNQRDDSSGRREGRAARALDPWGARDPERHLHRRRSGAAGV